MSSNGMALAALREDAGSRLLAEALIITHPILTGAAALCQLCTPGGDGVHVEQGRPLAL